MHGKQDTISVSMIVPVYNSEAYLKACIESILGQTMKSLELILVDDGSQDNSGKICDEYAKKDARVTVIHQENAGRCAARNNGLRMAKGEYVGFADNDDTCGLKLIEDNYKVAKRNKADMVRFGRELVHYKDGKIVYRKNSIPFQNQVVVGDDVLKMYSTIRNSSNGVWAGLYKRNIIEENGLHFEECLTANKEDVLFNIHFYRYVKTLVLNEKTYYYWNLREGHSGSTRFDANVFLGMDLCLEEDYKLIKDLDIERVSPGSWEEIASIYYIIEYYTSLLHPNCPYSQKEKVKIMKQKRENQIFAHVSRKGLAVLKKKNYRRYICYRLFLGNHHRINLFIVRCFLMRIHWI